MENIEFRIPDVDEYDGVMDFLAEHFNKMEPGSRCLGLSREEGDIFASKHAKHGLRQRVCIGAYDSITGEMVGFSLNALGGEEINEDDEDSAKRTLKVKQFDEHCFQITGTDVEKTMGTPNWFEIFMLTTDKKYGRRGIGQEMVRRSEAMAKEKGCDVIFTFASSEYTYRIVNKLRYEKRKEVACADYVDPFTNEKIFKNVEEPHLYMRLMVKRI